MFLSLFVIIPVGMTYDLTGMSIALSIVQLLIVHIATDIALFRRITIWMFPVGGLLTVALLVFEILLGEGLFSSLAQYDSELPLSLSMMAAWYFLGWFIARSTVDVEAESLI